jgi:mono/diheme cytochrome c family protein
MATGAQAGPSGHTSGRTSSTGDPTHGHGEELYNASCVVCHGPRAAGGVDPRLAGNPVLSNDQAFDRILSEGRHMMPPLKDTVTAKQLADIRVWLQTLP